MLIMHVVGARPNFMKAAPVMAAIRASKPGVEQLLLHTGQHYDANLSEIFFHELGLPQPDCNLEVGSASHAVQTAEIMKRFEQAICRGGLETRPDWVLVYGDVNSTVSAALVCAKLHIPIAHVEAGLRSFDRSMPEEINRVLTDQIATLLFTPSEDGNENLQREGIAEEKIHLVGNVMIDTLIRLLPTAADNVPALRERFELDRYGLVTLHRPSNVDDPQMLQKILQTLDAISHDLPLILPLHPRTRNRIDERSALFGQGLAHLSSRLKLVDPLGYLDFLALQSQATLIITDSGGIQEESTYLGVPCLTIRENTERPITITLGTNILIGQDMGRLQAETARILRGEAKKHTIPPLWDGKAGQRIADILLKADS